MEKFIRVTRIALGGTHELQYFNGMHVLVNYLGEVGGPVESMHAILNCETLHEAVVVARQIIDHEAGLARLLKAIEEMP